MPYPDDLSLDTVAELFDTWRSRKKKGKVPQQIPKPLVAHIQQLGKHYKRGHIAQKLKLSGTYINKILAIQEKPIDFIEIPAPAPVVVATMACHIQRQDGTTLSLQLDPPQLSCLIKDFLCCK